MEWTASLVLHDPIPPSVHPTERHSQAQASGNKPAAPQQPSNCNEVDTIGLSDLKTSDQARQSAIPNPGAGLHGWLSPLPVPIQSISCTPTPLLNDDGHCSYFGRQLGWLKVHSDWNQP